MATRSARPGLAESARRVAEHATALVRLELRLALQEVQEKAKRFALAASLLAVAGVLGLLAVLAAVGAGIAALALVLPVWAALLVVAGGLLLLAGPLGVAGLIFVRLAVPPVPEQAIAEARLTTEALTNGDR
jgi:fatty acid desaturase